MLDENTLYIYTDLDDTSWLKYIVEEFIFVQGAKFNINVLKLDNSEVSKDKNCIFYTQIPIKGRVSIYNSNKLLPKGEVEFLNKDFFIIKGTSTTERGFTINYDLFWNAFVFLSRYEEYLVYKKGKSTHSYSFFHPRKDKRTFFIPIVNMIFNALEKLIIQHFPHLRFEEKKSLVIDFSHDVDYISKTLQLRLKQTAMNCFNIFKSIKKFNIFIQNIRRVISFLVSSPSYWCFDYWRQIEKKYGIRSTFYIYAKVNKNVNIKSWLLDPSYDIEKENRLKAAIKELINEGFKIGLHGSFNSAIDPDLLRKEKEKLESILGINIEKVRQHWLNYDEDITPHAHEKLFEFDSTIGWNDIMGFRAGIASLYHPYSFKYKRKLNYVVIPLVIMDSHVYDYARSNSHDSLEKVISIIKKAEKFSKKPYISICWHQRVCSDDYKWNILYEELLKNVV